MARARTLQSIRRTADARPQRTRNLRTGIILIATFAALFLASVVYIIVFPWMH